VKEMVNGIQQEHADLFSFSTLVGIFIYLSLLGAGIGVFYEIGNWFYSTTLLQLSVVCFVAFVGSVIVFSWIAISKRKSANRK
jgi:hypothetical protein